ncbi:NADPH-dependent FMN reductase [Streptosporangium saharense]|uniref:NAD(P)H-dependent FMN reductase n=1 Tax=Streptosporangium saharense TaxID=1706840 RepID=A0A7W7QQ73_9ACTN|nr:NAD(P)H-dependent oxidoreductase [Streptosporangium saharense]MBB4917732.1 NAD(P)H-dependent FMN reductase [Streptosporangium saharense]
MKLLEPLRLAVIVGSVRQGRFGPTVANWFAAQAGNRDDVLVDLVDLADTPLPEALPAFGQPPGPEAARTLAKLTPRLEAADAFVVVTPEYNHSFPASLKTAIDWHFTQWQAKPVGFVSYGGMAGGLRAVEHLRAVFAELHAVTVRETVSFHGAWERFGPDGLPKDPDGCDAAAGVMLDQLLWWGHALREARARNPYTERKQAS